jgi:glycine/D-amino acid oxidase-like deaminating enzyme
MREVPAGFYWRSVAAEWQSSRGPGRPADRYDFVIVGGGVTGLWAAWHIRSRDAGASIAVLEAEHIAYGASGRNAGYLHPRFGLTYNELARAHGEEGGTLARAGVDNVAAVVKRIADLGIECDLVETDLLTVSTHPDFDARIERDMTAAERLGVKVQPLDTGELQRRIASPLLTSGFAEPGALVNPVKLTQGLASAVEARGVAIFEHTPARAVRPDGDGCEVVTADRTVRARRVILARNAWDARDHRLAPQVLPSYTYQAVTARLTDRQWSELAWERGEGVTDRRTIILNFRPTPDGRIMFGGRELVIPFGCRIARRYDASSRISRAMRESFEEVFPQLRSVPFEMTWGGPIATTPDHIPKVGLRHGGRVAYAHGCGGHGLAQSHLWSGAAVDLLFGETTDRSQLMFTRNLDLRYPPEPLRWLGGTATLKSLRRLDDAIQRGRRGDREPWLFNLVNRILRA